MKPAKLEFPLRTTLLYLLFGFLWILLSDQLLSLLIFHNPQQAIYQMLKSWSFILVSGILLYTLLHRSVAEHQQTEENLRRFELLSEYSRDIILFMRREDGHILEANSAAVQAYGYSHDELLTLSIQDLRAAGTYNLTTQQMAQADTSGILFETVHLRKNKSTFPVEVSSRGATIAGVRSLVSIVRDISERERVNQENAWLASFPERNPNPVVEIDDSGAVFYMNPTAQHKFPDLPVQGFKHPWLAGLDSVIARFQKEGIDELQREIQIGEAWYSQPVYYVPEADRLRVYGTDITQRKQTEEHLQRSEWMLRAVLDQMPSGVTVRDARTGDLVISNARSREIMGALVKSVDEFSQYQGFHPDGHPYHTEDWPVFRSIATGEIVHAEEIAYERSDGIHRTLSISSAPVRDEQGQIVMGVGIFDDITGRKQIEESLRRLTEDLQRSNAELEQFAYVASHDLQEPLRMVSSYMQLLSKRYRGKLDSDADEFIGFAVDGAKRMQNLINDLLAYSRVGTRGKPLTDVSSEEVLKDAIANLQFMIEESEAQITYEPMPVVHGDPIQLIMVFQNLLGNAIKFRSSEPPHIHVGIGQEGNEWIFSVHDNGIGIDPKYYERIFVIFQRLNDRSTYPGTGIGLAICKRIIERHTGRIWVESKPGEGSTFYFTLPIQESL